jgi:hypothetical protein
MSDIDEEDWRLKNEEMREEENGRETFFCFFSVLSRISNIQIFHGDSTKSLLFI